LEKGNYLSQPFIKVDFEVFLEAKQDFSVEISDIIIQFYKQE